MLKMTISSMMNCIQSLIVANGHLNISYLMKGMCKPSFVRWQALEEAVRPRIL